jgi:protein-S-isoprenylcysteine O-methyltransferase Ste14
MGRRLVFGVFVVLATSAVADAVASLAHAASHGGTRPWLAVGFTSLKACVVVTFAILVARRGQALRRTRQLTAYVACGAAMVALVALERPNPDVGTAYVLAGEALAVVAVTWMLVSTLALGRCFGVLPEARGLVTGGPYRLVRHPLYLGELGTCAGLVVASPSGRNVFAAVVFALAQAARMLMEERELTRQFPEYRVYAARTPRLIPVLHGRGGAT